jgi:tartrate-resistant acid phosphatase type 5
MSRRGMSSTLLVIASLLFALAAALVRAVPGAAAGPTTLAVIGDFGTATAAEESVASLVAGWSPDAIVTVGDDYYASAGGSGTDRYDLTIGRYYCGWLAGAVPGAWCPSGGTAGTNRFWPSTGNHDYTDGGIGNYTGYFALPGNERTYSVTVGPVELFIVDSQAALGSSAEMSAQKAWLEAAAKASTAPWRVAVFHHPPFSSAAHGSTAAMRWPYADWGIDLVLTGHDHSYERVLTDGMTYIVDGLGGAGRYSFGTPVAGSAARYNADWGALRLVVSESALDGQFISLDGTAQDSFRLSPTHDRLAPSSSVTALPNTQPSSPFAVAWSGTDAMSGIASFDIQSRDDGSTPPGGTGTPGDWTPWRPDTTETTATFTGAQAHRYCFRSRATDVAGNVEAWPDGPDTCTRLADTTIAGGEIVLAGGAAFTGPATVSVAIDQPDTDITAMRFSEDAAFGGSDWQPFAATSSFTFPGGDGPRTLYAQLRDADGNVSVTISDSITLDTAAPQASLLRLNDGALSATGRTLDVHLESSDEASGVASYRLSDVGGDWSGWSDWPAGAASVDADWTVSGGDGAKSVRAQVRDAAGNVSSPASGAIDLDSSVASPDYGVSVDAGAPFTGALDVVLDLYAPPGTAQVQVSNDGAFLGATWEPYLGHRAWTLPDPDGRIITQNVYVRFRAGTSGAATTVSDGIVIDMLAPRPGRITTSQRIDATPLPEPEPTTLPKATPEPTGSPLPAPGPEDSPEPAVTAEPAASPDPATEPSPIPLLGPVAPAVVEPSSTVTARLSTRANDQAQGSGVQQMMLSTSPTFPGAVWEPYATSRAVTYDTRAATTVHLRFRDGAGNVSVPVSIPLPGAPAPSVPTQVAPFHRTTATSHRPIFRWLPLAGLTGYQVQVADSTTFEHPLLSLRAAGTSIRATGALPTGQPLYWRVRGTGGAWSPAWRFAVPAADAPRLLAPAADAALTTLWPTLDWSNIASATAYQVQLAVDPGFVGVVRTAASAVSDLDLTGLARDATYHWRVRAQVGGTWGAWSNGRTFRTPSG